jgi:uncharacterized protein YggT (Ycf19 family)
MPLKFWNWLNIEAEFIIGLLIASLLCWFSNKRVVKPLYEFVIKLYGPHTIEDERLTEASALIGRLEGIIYIYSVMMASYDLALAWIILKAFHEWTSSSKEPNTPQRVLLDYYLYLAGNAISLFHGVFWGGVGLLVEHALAS